MIITISGHIGSGKSTLARSLADKLGWEYFGMGKIRRHAADAAGLTLAEFNRLGESDRSTDDLVDNYQIELSKHRDNIIVEGRLSWFFIPQSLKVFLTVDPELAATRLYQESLTGGRSGEFATGSTVADILLVNQARLASDRRRYQEYYHLDPYQTNYFDLVVDTTNLTPSDTLNQVWDYVQSKLT